MLRFSATKSPYKKLVVELSKKKFNKCLTLNFRHVRYLSLRWSTVWNLPIIRSKAVLNLVRLSVWTSSLAWPNGRTSQDHGSTMTAILMVGVLMLSGGSAVSMKMVTTYLLVTSSTSFLHMRLTLRSTTMGLKLWHPEFAGPILAKASVASFQRSTSTRMVTSTGLSSNSGLTLP